MSVLHPDPKTAKNARAITWLIGALVFLIMVSFSVWNNVEQRVQTGISQRQAQAALTLVAEVSKQRDQAFAEIRVLVANGEATSARDSANLGKLLAYISALNHRDALLFTYLHKIGVSIPADLLTPIPQPRLITASASPPKAKGKAKGHHHHK